MTEIGQKIIEMSDRRFEEEQNTLSLQISAIEKQLKTIPCCKKNGNGVEPSWLVRMLRRMGIRRG